MYKYCNLLFFFYSRIPNLQIIGEANLIEMGRRIIRFNEQEHFSYSRQDI